MWGQLTIIDTESWVYVAPSDDRDDWVARFEKAHGFPALEWAERMAALHNSELRTRGMRSITPPVTSAYAPFDPR